MIERVPRLIGLAIGRWMEGGPDTTGWLRVYPHDSEEHIKLTISFYSVGQEYEGKVTVVEDAPGAIPQLDIDLEPQGKDDK